MSKIIEINHLTKCYVKDTPAVYDFNLEVEKGEFVTFLGPSGCGKTTILRMIAGFEQPTEGHILLEGKDIINLPPYERKVNTVFQKYALFPHLNIFDNIAFGLRQKNLPKDLIEEKVRDVLDVVDLEGFEKRRVSSLSGGQQQRIAIARAIVNEPEILLLDEPLGALDYKMRQEMQLELKRMHQELGITFIFVTHDQEEALTMSDKIVVMSKGIMQQTGTPEEIYNHPKNAFVADFVGESNIFAGVKKDERTAYFAGREFTCKDEIPAGSKIEAMIRPELVELTAPEEGQLVGEVIDNTFKGKTYEITVQCDKNEIVAERSRGMKVGETVGICFPEDAIHNMLSDVMLNRFKGDVTEQGQLRLADGDVSIDLHRIFEGYKEVDGVFYDKEDNAIDLSKKEVELYFSPYKAELSDDKDAGLFCGHITSIIYKGDHYSYRVISENNVEYAVYDEYLWNEGDYVSILVPEEIREYHLLEKQ